MMIKPRPNIGKPDELLWEEYAKLRGFHRLSTEDFKFARGVFLDGMSWERAIWESE